MSQCDDGDNDRDQDDDDDDGDRDQDDDDDDGDECPQPEGRCESDCEWFECRGFNSYMECFRGCSDDDDEEEEEEQHLVCIQGQCALVDGAGRNECFSAQDCQDEQGECGFQESGNMCYDFCFRELCPEFGAEIAGRECDYECSNGGGDGDGDNDNDDDDGSGNDCAEETGNCRVDCREFRCHGYGSYDECLNYCFD